MLSGPYGKAPSLGDADGDPSDEDRAFQAGNGGAGGIDPFLYGRHLSYQQAKDRSVRGNGKAGTEPLEKLDYEKGYSLYVGIPFCPTTCLYCSFTSYPISAWEKKIPLYLDALFQELTYTAKRMKGRVPGYDLFRRRDAYLSQGGGAGRDPFKDRGAVRLVRGAGDHGGSGPAGQYYGRKAENLKASCDHPDFHQSPRP